MYKRGGERHGACCHWPDQDLLFPIRRHAWRSGTIPTSIPTPQAVVMGMTTFAAARYSAATGTALAQATSVGEEMKATRPTSLMTSGKWIPTCPALAHNLASRPISASLSTR